MDGSCRCHSISGEPRQGGSTESNISGHRAEKETNGSSVLPREASMEGLTRYGECAKRQMHLVKMQPKIGHAHGRHRGDSLSPKEKRAERSCTTTQGGLAAGDALQKGYYKIGHWACRHSSLILRIPCRLHVDTWSIDLIWGAGGGVGGGLAGGDVRGVGCGVG